MQTFADISALREQIKQYKRDGRQVAFVPTMGNLHEGHLTLVRKARELADIVVVSIFVNPMQFDRADDLNNYPRTLDEDLSKLNSEGVDLVFTPTPDVMYPHGLDKQTFVEVPGLSHMLEGASRPGHFRGVATIVSKLFNIVQPNIACFGEKDFQQLAVIRQMVNDLCLDIEIVGVPTVREMDGLAMSSRNNLLTIDERQRAPVLARTMRWMSSAIRGGRDDYPSIIEDAIDQLRAADLEPDNIFIRDAHTLQPITSDSKQAVILIAAHLGKVRLIDNQVLDLSGETKESSEEE
ncbi:pantoate--beta-alanine ligase [Vibrio cincinnatiensis]|jgi:pantoate--beta-alanine ligase|uniref:Pantothenate synthetase n=1 Tax=Vibrio cincinnatiensis DSM 19608 TaxID=1123491 RepID=A0A1T4PBT7_VIBCI|nr:pantoate--beta-alanine ligase [Vibrio cincinnatiensis]MCG3721731.1 pantoate--beta-alanine ligase [Vibrio cincinnatiensis]MCG3724534.1 pantoate--beta-alanine ligase [Vibrio cincinnatiensis]MCG3731465.1 pantoate--beta-alanine ligase [Vibrio cincinnatiensis]MCG3735153.1 pantoate--beta-alanine ligase [Vibrio cincinnatiensis]MCG3739160.1 pantoate--beta-alanine ligase [Vibrio cincinnatiensis]